MAHHTKPLSQEASVFEPWRVAFRHQGKVLTGGYYATAEEASEAHDRLRRELGYTQPGFFNKVRDGSARGGNMQQDTQSIYSSVQVQ